MVTNFYKYIKLYELNKELKMNLLITRHDKIGDFVVTFTTFKAIKEQYPNTKNHSFGFKNKL